MQNIREEVWIFNGEGSRFPGGAFLDKAEAWIRVNKLTGMLTLYPLNEGAYDWAVRNNFFTPQNEKEKSPGFMGSFTSAGQEHYHYLNGEQD